MGEVSGAFNGLKLGDHHRSMHNDQTQFLKHFETFKLLQN